MSRPGLAVLVAALTCLPLVVRSAEPPRPNVLVILADDLGFSDVGAYGGEIDTPHLDRLAAGGLVFTQGYNTARCWPTRAALLTGYYPQAIGRDALPGGKGGTGGRRPGWATLLPERLAAAGYRSYHSGKWHVDGDPRGQGFVRSLDVLDVGQSNFFDPRGVTADGGPVAAGAAFYTTTAIGDHAVECLAEHAREHPGKPFFHYVAFTAPHFPLQAPADVIARYRERYLAGWDDVRAARSARLAAAGIVTTAPAEPEPAVAPPYQPKPPTLARLGSGELDRPRPWETLTAEQREFQATKMAIHAAMVDVMDREVGRILAQLEATGALANTLILFLSDNGASAEIMIRGEGHDPAAPPGSRKTFLCLGPGWSSCANTPFRRHKTWVHEGGIATPWIVHWPRGIAARGELRRQPVHAIDLVPTVLELAGVAAEQARPAPPLQGRSFTRALVDPAAPPAHESLWWCHEGNRAVRVGDWKLVAARGEPWELYDLAGDRCETENLAAAQPDRVADLEAEWNRIAGECQSLASVQAVPAQPPPPAPAAAAGSPRPPNVVIVFADDLGYGDLGCYGGMAAATPAIDSLARAGIRFTDFHVAQAVCSASRAALLTGCYPNRIGISGALGPAARHGIAAEETTLAELLRARGYRTAAVGKWHLGHHPPFLPTRHGFDEYFGLPYSNDMWPHHPELRRGTFPPLPLLDGEEIVDPEVTPEDQATLTARYADRAVRFIERAGTAADGRPFFLYLAHSMPHVPLFAGAEFRGKSPGGLYGDVLAEIDASVAALLAALDRTGHADDTLVIFTSDNGPWLSYGNHGGSAGPLREGKGTSFEGGVRVPCVARLPGVIPAGTVCDAPTMTIDLVPTIAALTGAPLPADRDGCPVVEGRRIDGRDIGPLLRGEPDPTSNPVSFFWYADNELQAVRAGQWKLFFPHTARSMAGQPPGRDGIPGRYRPLPVDRALYDLATDPGESRDVAAAHPEVVVRLEALAEQARAELGDSLRKRQGSGVRPAGSLREAAVADPSPVSLAAARPAASPSRPVAGRRPNVIYVMTDDQGYGDLAAHGNPVVRTPNLDRLRDQSVRLTEFHVSPTCAPTRAALLTGRHEFRSGVTHTIFERERLALDAVTLPEILRRSAGYTTGIFGKWHLGDEDAYQPGRRGFDRVFIHGGGGIGQSYPGSCGDAPGNTSFDPVIRSDGTFVRTKGYCTDVFFDAAIDWIDRCRQDQKSFFCYLTPNCPHAPHDCPPGSDKKYLGPLERAGIEDPGQRATLARFYALIENIDANVGRLLAKLDEWGLAEETLLVFSTDNGTAAGAAVANGGMRGQKGTPYRGGTRVPAFWRWPGTLPAGVDVGAVTAHIDVLPTLCELAGATIPPAVAAQVEGRSLVPLLEDAEAAWPDRPLVTHVGRWERGRAAESARRDCRVRAGRWQLVNTRNRSDAWELYDLATDPGEQRNVAALHPDVVARLGRAHDAWWESVQGDLVNEDLDGPNENPFAVAFRDQFGPAATAAAAPAVPSAAAKPTKRPNILFIIADDQSPFDLRAYDPASRLETPAIDGLAARGCVLDAAYQMGSFSGAVCSPSRHMIMTGRSLWHLPIGPGDGQPAGVAGRCPADIEDHVLAAVFNAAGYDTMRTCKQGNSYEAANRRFTVRHDAVKRQGTAQGGSAWHADRVLDFLAAREAAGVARPFLIYFGFSHPHDTRDGTPELLAKYGATNHADPARPPPLAERQPPLPANWLPRHPFDDTHMDSRDEVAVSGVWRRRDEATIRNEIGRQFACSENIDIQIGRVLDKLRAMGELDDTWIIYTADHGMAIGRHGLQGKQNLYEPTWRVPLIVAGPGVKPGSRAPGNVYLADVLATLCDIAGIPPPPTNEGTSFLPVLTGEKPQVREVLYGAYSGGGQPGIRGVRRGDWKLLKYESPAGGLVTQLFNLRENPEEFLAEHHDPAVRAVSRGAPAPHQRNLADDPAHAARRRELEALLLAEMQRHDDPHRFSDQPPREIRP